MAKKITTEEAMQDLAKRNHFVEGSKASAMVKKYKGFRTKLTSAKKNGGALPASVPEMPLSVTYNKKAIQKLLKNTACAGLRIYPAINDENSLTFILVGVDEKGDNILGGNNGNSEVLTRSAMTTLDSGSDTLDEGQSNPPYPGGNNAI